MSQFLGEDWISEKKCIHGWAPHVVNSEALRKMDSIDADDREPSPFPGVSLFMLPPGLKPASLRAFLKFNSGAQYPAHTHGDGEHCLVFRGSIRDQKGLHTRGDYVYFGPATEHSSLQAEEECVILVVAEGAVRFD